MYINDSTTLIESLSSRLHFQADVDTTEETCTNARTEQKMTDLVRHH